MKKWWWVGAGLLIVVLTAWNRYQKESGQKPTPAGEWDSASTEIENNVGADRRIRPIFKFAVMADVHNDTESLAKALVQARANGDEMVLVAGDLTIDGTKSEEEKVKLTLESSGMEYFVVPGNHDTYKNVWLWEQKYKSIKKGSLKFLLIDNSNWRGLGDGQKKWLGDELPECKVVRCMAVMHVPLINNFSKHVMGEYSKTTAMEAEWLKNILLENNVVIGYSGHLHYASSYTVDNWETVLVGAISKDRNTQTPRYTEVVVEGDGVVKNEVKILN